MYAPSQSPGRNNRMRDESRRFVLEARPTGIAGPEHFAEETVPVRTPDSGELLLETLLLSIDQAMRVWISENAAMCRPSRSARRSLAVEARAQQVSTSTVGRVS
jgi:NADPH-dependent curcumin reductase CurA